MRTEDLIRDLSRDARPVRRLRPTAVRLLGWLVIAAASAAVVVLGTGVRRDLGEVMWAPSFALEAGLLLLTALSAAAGALIVSVPGAERSALVRWLPITAAVAALLWVGGELAVIYASGLPAGRIGPAWSCVMKTLSVAAVPGFALFVMLRQAAPLRAGWAGALAVLATAAVGVLGTNAVCPVDRPLHVLLWHVIPMMGLAAVGAGLGSWLLGWTRRLR